MIAVSLKEGEDLTKLFLSKGADVNATSEFLKVSPRTCILILFSDFAGQVTPPSRLLPVP